MQLIGSEAKANIENTEKTLFNTTMILKMRKPRISKF